MLPSFHQPKKPHQPKIPSAPRVWSPRPWDSIPQRNSRYLSFPQLSTDQTNCSPLSAHHPHGCKMYPGHELHIQLNCNTTNSMWRANSFVIQSNHYISNRWDHEIHLLRTKVDMKRFFRFITESRDMKVDSRCKSSTVCSGSPTNAKTKIWILKIICISIR